MSTYIIYLYVLLRWIIVVALLITMVISFIVSVIKRKWQNFVIGLLCSIIIFSMFNIGLIRTSTLDVRDLCENFDNIERYINNCNTSRCIIENEKVWTLLYTEETEYEFSTEKVKSEVSVISFSSIENAAEKAKKRVKIGKINDVNYYLTGMVADFSQESFYTYTGAYDGIAVLQKNNKQIIIIYSIMSKMSDPRIIFYCFRPNKIFLSDYLC